MREKKHDSQPPWILVLVVSALLLVVFGHTAEASWNPLAGRPDLLAVHASPVGDVIRGFVGQFFTLVMMAVAVVVGVPLLIAGLAFSASYVVSRLGDRIRKRHPVVAAKAPTVAS